MAQTSKWFALRKNNAPLAPKAVFVEAETTLVEGPPSRGPKVTALPASEDQLRNFAKLSPIRSEGSKVEQESEMERESRTCPSIAIRAATVYIDLMLSCCH